ncbi:hypothetical protein Isop_3438 [Isosphaera pallida ATCC 43644]|jgi:hypothetical protein|uniref:Uncharacterized protein n=1 Tax=Isosphaera pallida (strain ATCC 43644 / DSM 9630 / IS1B) TaxID=575540 RepID=E8R6U3_ISOPI|nr:hypothetical protein [Isosphaera pallida]ADV63995.1 hypothetical protein Isop_3438 [Isosphaera pallida ATCC 43644]
MPAPSRIVLNPVDRPDAPALPISERLRGQLVYFLTPADTPGLPPLGENEYWFAADEVARWLEDGVIRLVSPLDTANLTEVELTEEQEAFLGWLKTYNIRHVKVNEG